MADVAKAARIDYGLDSPGMVRGIGILGLLTLGIGYGVRLPEDLWYLAGPIGALRVCGLLCMAQVGLLLYSSYVGKLRARDVLIDSIPWRGDERVLDAGCGRGLLLIAAAKRLQTGKAVGVDAWRSADLSNNWAEGTWDNARAEGVEDRIEIQDADIRELPFEDSSFDIVMSSLTLYTFAKDSDRLKAVDEMMRVLKPGGRLLIADVARTGLYSRTLRAALFTDVKLSRRIFQLFPPGRVVSAVKPASAAAMK